MIIRAPLGTWETLSSPSWLPVGARLTNSRLIHGSRPEPVGPNQGRNGGNRQAKETKCGEMDGKESECLIVALKRRNGPYRTPWSEGGAALWAQRRNHAEGIEPPSVLLQGNGSCEGQRHNVTNPMPLTGTSGSVGDLGWVTTQVYPARPRSDPVQDRLPDLTLRQESSGKENRQCETFRRNPAGNQSRPAEPGQQPEASLAWGTGNRHCEA